MLDISTALEMYAARISDANLINYPEAWAVHYADDRIKGELVARLNNDPAQAVFWLMLPFGFASEVTESLVLFEAHRAPTPDTALLDAERVLYGSRLAVDGAGYRTTHWIVPYRIGDAGRREFGEPRMSPYFVPKLNDALGLLLNHRESGPLFSFEEACLAVIGQ